MRKKLPSKWCVKVKPYSTPNEIYQWRLTTLHNSPWINPGYLDEIGYHTEKTCRSYRTHIARI